MSKRLTDEELLKQYKNLSDKLGRPATYFDIKHSLEVQFVPTTISNRFGGMDKVREILGYSQPPLPTKQQILSILRKQYIIRGRKLDIIELRLVEDLPSPERIKEICNVNSINELWEEVIDWLQQDGFVV